MKGRIVILPNGKVNIFIDEGTFEEAEKEIASLISLLEADGISFDEVGKVEAHRHEHGSSHAHVNGGI